MTDAVEEIGNIVPIAQSGRPRAEAPRRDAPPEKEDAPKPPSAHPYKGNVLDVMA